MKTQPTPYSIVVAVCDHFGQPTDWLFQHTIHGFVTRSRTRSEAKRLASYLMRKAGHSYPEIAEELRYTSHSTPYDHVRTVEADADAKAVAEAIWEQVVR